MGDMLRLDITIKGLGRKQGIRPFEEAFFEESERIRFSHPFGEHVGRIHVPNYVGKLHRIGIEAFRVIYGIDKVNDVFFRVPVSGPVSLVRMEIVDNPLRAVLVVIHDYQALLPFVLEKGFRFFHQVHERDVVRVDGIFIFLGMFQLVDALRNESHVLFGKNLEYPFEGL